METMQHQFLDWTSELRSPLSHKAEDVLVEPDGIEPTT